MGDTEYCTDCQCSFPSQKKMLAHFKRCRPNWSREKPSNTRLYSISIFTEQQEGPIVFLAKAKNKKQAEELVRNDYEGYVDDEEKMYISEVDFGKSETVQIDMGEE